MVATRSLAGTRAAPRWNETITWAAAADLAVTIGLVAAVRDPDAAMLSVAIGAGVALWRWKPRVGAAVLLAVFADIELWTATALWSNAREGSGTSGVLIPGWLATFSAVGGASALAGVIRPQPAGAATPRLRRTALAGAASGVVVTLVLALAPGIASAVRPLPGDIRLVTSSALFDQEHLTARAGTVGVYVRNRDLFWHTFTIDELGVDLRIPVGGARRITFDAPPGTYSYVCRVPGHDARMTGTLVVG